MMNKVKWMLALVALLAYVGSYAVLSCQGKYVPLICGTSDGSEHWYPLGSENRTPSWTGRIKTEYPSLLGFLYLPLLLLDQKFIHPSKPGISITAGTEPSADAEPAARSEEQP